EMASAAPAGGNAQSLAATVPSEWDDEELETQIYDNPQDEVEAGRNGTAEGQIEDPDDGAKITDRLPPAKPATPTSPTHSESIRPTNGPGSGASSPGAVRWGTGPTMMPSVRVPGGPSIVLPPTATGISPGTFGARFEPRRGTMFPAAAILAGVVLL